MQPVTLPASWVARRVIAGQAAGERCRLHHEPALPVVRLERDRPARR
jgi:hypothetical protein